MKTLYYTTFDNFDSTTHTDIPDIGEPTLWPTDKQSYVRGTLTYNNVQYNALYNTAIGRDIVPDWVTLCDISECQQVSCECIFLTGGTRYDFGGQIGFSPLSVSIDPGFDGANPKIRGPYVNNTDYTFYNGTTLDNYVHQYAHFYENVINNALHYAVVMDKETNTLYHYIDGTLRVKQKYSLSSVNTSMFWSRWNNTGHSFTFTRLAVYNYSRASDDFLTYTPEW